MVVSAFCMPKWLLIPGEFFVWSWYLKCIDFNAVFLHCWPACAASIPLWTKTLVLALGLCLHRVRCFHQRSCLRCDVQRRRGLRHNVMTQGLTTGRFLRCWCKQLPWWMQRTRCVQTLIDDNQNSPKNKYHRGRAWWPTQCPVGSKCREIEKPSGRGLSSTETKRKPVIHVLHVDATRLSATHQWALSCLC